MAENGKKPPRPKLHDLMTPGPEVAVFSYLTYTLTFKKNSAKSAMWPSIIVSNHMISPYAGILFLSELVYPTRIPILPGLV